MKSFVIGLCGVAFLTLWCTGCGLHESNKYYWDRRLHNSVTQNTNSVQSPDDRMHTLKTVADQDARAFVDDWDYMFLMDRPSRLSRWHNR
jgi:hypothetical protein